MSPDVHSNLSKLAAGRMSRLPVAGPHPDAGQLTAFAERSLAGAEREGVLAHLATCADCREVVALAAPEPLAGLEAVAPAKAHWLTIPAVPVDVMRWGAVAAAVAVVAIAVVMQSPRMQPPAPSSTSSSASRTNADVVAKAEKPAPAQSPAVSSAGKGSEHDRDAGLADLRDAERKNSRSEGQLNESRNDALAKQKKEDAGRAVAAITPPVAAPEPPQHAAEANRVASVREFRVSPAKAANQPAAAPPNDKDQFHAASAKPASDTKAAGASDATESMQAARAAPSPEPAPARAKSYDATSSGAAGSGSAALYGPGYAGGNMARRSATMNDEAAQHAQLKPATLRWTVTSDGRVQRSRDGRNWADVPIVKDKTVKFRALASDGDEVWAGGARGALYYSADAGSTWRAYPVEQVTGDIIRLNVNGKTVIISTSSGQTISVSHDVFGDTAVTPPTSR